MSFTKNGDCLFCERHSTWQLERHFFAGGSENFAWRCTACERLNPSKTNQWIPAQKVNSTLTPERIEALPQVMPQFYNRCAICGDRNAQLHHWAPKHLFDDAEKWPKDYLCERHHTQWHATVTPNMCEK